MNAQAAYDFYDKRKNCPRCGRENYNKKIEHVFKGFESNYNCINGFKYQQYCNGIISYIKKIKLDSLQDTK